MTRTATGEALQPGPTFDIALALQGRMPGGRIAVSAASRQLLLRRFATQALPPLHLQDLDVTVAVYELGIPLKPASREGGLLPPLVNRTPELQLLLDRFRLAASGAGQAVLIVGDAGIGKSHLVEAFLEQIAADATEAVAAPIQLLAHGSVFAQNTPLAPILHLLSQAIFAPEDASESTESTESTEGAESAESAESSGEEKLRQLEAFLAEHALPVAEHGPLLGALLSLPVEERYPPLALSPDAARRLLRRRHPLPGRGAPARLRGRASGGGNL